MADVVEHPEEAAVRGLLAIAERGRGGLAPPLLVVGGADPHGVPVRVDGDVLGEDVRGPAPPEEAEVAETLPRLSMWTILRDPNSMCGCSSDTS